jgi:hypothetical protein
MMVGSRYYSEADMMRMQRDAEQRVREMRNRSRQTAQNGGGSSFMPAFANPNRNWNTGPGQQRGRNHFRVNPQPPPAAPNIEPGPEPTPSEPEVAQTVDNTYAEPENTQANAPFEAASAEKQGTTIIEDIVGSLGIESDTLLIIGLILILINQKADTTLILALAYLLI